jgi:hypothetical protein
VLFWSKQYFKSVIYQNTITFVCSHTWTFWTNSKALTFSWCLKEKRPNLLTIVWIMHLLCIIKTVVELSFNCTRPLSCKIRYSLILLLQRINVYNELSFVYVLCRIECFRCAVEHLLWFHQDIHAYIMSLMFQKFEIFMRKKNWLQKIEICMKVLCTMYCKWLYKSI